MPPNKIAPTEVLADQGRGGEKQSSANQISECRAKRKNGNAWREGRYLFRYGPNGSIVFDTWVWFGEPLPRRRA